MFGEDLYVWYIDGQMADSGVPQGAFPDEFSFIIWRAKAWHLENTTKWSYIRYGKLPVASSGDFDSDSTVELFDFFYFRECAGLSGPSLEAEPGCRWADMDSDSDVDFHDFGHFQRVFTGSE